MPQLTTPLVVTKAINHEPATWAKFTAFLTEKTRSGDGWSLKLSKVGFDVDLARGEKSTAIWGFELTNSPAFRIHLFKYPRIVLSTPGRLKDELTDYFSIEGQIEHFEQKERPKNLLSEDTTTGNLLELRISNPGKTQTIPSMTMTKNHIFSAEFHVEDGVATRDIIAVTFAEKDTHQAFVMALTYPTGTDPRLAERLQTIFFDSVRSFKIVAAKDDKWNGLFNSPIKPA